MFLGLFELGKSFLRQSLCLILLNSLLYQFTVSGIITRDIVVGQSLSCTGIIDGLEIRKWSEDRFAV
jgi:hypothetical protein